MNEAIVKDEVIEGEFNFTFQNEEFVEVKQEEIERKPENLLENEIKTQPDEFYEPNESDTFFEELEPEKESDFKIKKVSTGVANLKCTICQKKMPRNLLKLITLEEDKTVLSKNFKVPLFVEMNPTYVCISHVQMIIDGYDGKLKSPTNRYEQLLRSFITKNKYKMQKKMKYTKTRRRNCQVCHILKDCSELYEITSKGVRMVIMIGGVLRGTHSVEQAMYYVTTNRAFTCYSHCKESIDTIFEYLGVRNVLELSKCSTQAMNNLMDIVKKIDSNFKIHQFIKACRELYQKSQKLPSSL
ncbi:unnamed protein product [Caenorhabditis nigoni]